MQKAIVAKNASNQVCAMMVYAGDLTGFDAEFDAWEAAYPTYTFIRYEDDQNAEFLATEIEAYEPITK